MQVYDFKEFLKLSSVLNYNLSAASLSRYNVLLFIIGDKHLDGDEHLDREKKSIVMEALNYLFNAYSGKRRRLGPLAVLHPLRAAALFARSRDDLNLVSLLMALFHDILEDIKPSDFEKLRWRSMEEEMTGILDKLSEKEEAALIDGLGYLTRHEQETYYHYIGRLLRSAEFWPDLVQIKLADRLDNTLDMRIELQDPLEGVDFFQAIFQVLFVNNYPGYRPAVEHPTSAIMNGARRLYQLFKNAVILSLIRQMQDACKHLACHTLFEALADASLREAQRTLIHLLGYHLKDLTEQRKLLLETMEYCYGGRTELVTEPDTNQMLDGLFSTYFGQTASNLRNQQLDQLYQNKPLMFEASLAFIVIFLSFLNDRDYYVKGIRTSGIHPK
ncbi:MAG: hypothetical protein AMJ54_13670 [Deltaproteobacteria bacterium SG8_13]|nr:MAG: hypothetical protein AMJ54_13670 [Deltaproteobacteria bacterium SG8_13]